jgi:hypothetical protein
LANMRIPESQQTLGHNPALERPAQTAPAE